MEVTVGDLVYLRNNRGYLGKRVYRIHDISPMGDYIYIQFERKTKGAKRILYVPRSQVELVNIEDSKKLNEQFIISEISYGNN